MLVNQDDDHDQLPASSMRITSTDAEKFCCHCSDPVHICICTSTATFLFSAGFASDMYAHKQCLFAYLLIKIFF